MAARQSSTTSSPARKAARSSTRATAARRAGRATAPAPTEDAPSDRGEVLLDLQRRLKRELDDATGTAVANLSRELRLVTAELDALGTPKARSVVDEIAKRRAARRAGSSGS